ncbi:MAG: hypothetical protein CAPSK01_001328 [Candidatus Accumulibacter vicinus]|uniref:Uncharacterized protein n=1 Tax=Candidatus Accumulibacter vicinus TaxID=2954382 RepID=A0A084Y343_9PROT|nr:MAG: hypothetical protein CAPSK01_001328 [Candidatus Accumulibacter vicinus]
MSTLALGLAILLQTVRPPSDFQTMRRSEIDATPPEVTGVGPVSLPL